MNQSNSRGGEVYHGGHASYKNTASRSYDSPQHAAARPIADLRPGDTVVSAKKTFFRTVEDFKQAYTVILSLLSRPEIGPKGAYQVDDNGLYVVEDAISSIKYEDPGLSYLGRDHITELYLKDPLRKLIYNGTKIGNLGGGMAVPPDVLYYATTSRIAEKIRSKGLMSPSKPYLPLSTSSEDACRKCSWFVKNSGDDLVLISIDARGAFDDHAQFSFSGKDGEFLVERISPRYVLELENRGPVVGDLAGGNIDDAD